MPRVHKCRACLDPLPGGRVSGLCEGCKAQARRLGREHRAGHAGECPADRLAKRLLVATYADLVAHRRRIFE